MHTGSSNSSGALNTNASWTGADLDPAGVPWVYGAAAETTALADVATAGPGGRELLQLVRDATGVSGAEENLTPGNDAAAGSVPPGRRIV